MSIASFINAVSMASLSLPYVILPSIQDTEVDAFNNNNTTSFHRSILTVSENKRYECKNIFKGLVDAWCVGSSHGWLVLLDKEALPLLLNPSSRTRIHLPPFPHSIMPPVPQIYFVESLRKNFIIKAVLMCTSSSRSNYIIVIIYGCQHKLAFCKSGKWAELSDAKRSYDDIVNNNNHLYALAQDGSIEAWDICQQFPKRILDVKPTMEIEKEEEIEFPGRMFSTKLYMVMTEGEILLVTRYIGNFVNEDGKVIDEGSLLSLEEDTLPLICPYRTKHFSVHKLDFINIKWEKVRSLHNQVLFLGANESTSVAVQACPGCEANSIYFSDDKWEEMNLDYSYGGHDWGVFSLKDRSVKLLTPYADRIDPPPIWVVPTAHSQMFP